MPKRILTAKQIASIPSLVTRYGDGRRLARRWGVSPCAIYYHLRGGKAAAALRDLRADRLRKRTA